MGVTWAVEVRPERKGNCEVDSEPTWGGFRVDGVITRRVTKLFPPNTGIWDYGETEARTVEPGEQTNPEVVPDVQGGRPESFQVMGPNTAKLLDAIAQGDLSWSTEDDGEDRGDRYSRR